MDLPMIPREFPQFGKSLRALTRPRSEVFAEDSGCARDRHATSASDGRRQCCGGRCSSSASSSLARPSVPGQSSTRPFGDACGSSWGASGELEPCCDGNECGCGSSQPGWAPILPTTRGGGGGVASLSRDRGPGGECPPPCLAAADAVRACFAALGGARNDREFDRAREMCMAMLDSYRMICAHFVGCPVIDAPPPRRRCGGDVTNEMVEEMNKAWNACGGGLSPLSLLDYKEKLGDRGTLNWKKQPPKGKDCNIRCPDTLAICGICLSNSVPANIMYGYIAKSCGMPAGWIRDFARDFAEKWVVEIDPDAPWVDTGRRYGQISRPSTRRRMTGHPWPAHDQAAVDLGIALATGPVTSASLCKAVAAAAATLQQPDDANCQGAYPC